MLLVLDLLPQLPDLPLFVKNLGSGLIFDLAPQIGLIGLRRSQPLTHLEFLVLKLLNCVFFVLNVKF